MLSNLNISFSSVNLLNILILLRSARATLSLIMKMSPCIFICEKLTSYAIIFIYKHTCVISI